MPNLAQSFMDHDLGHQRIVADLWRVEVALPDARKGRDNLAQALLDVELVNEIVAALPKDAQTALGSLQSNGQRLPWTEFARRFGEVREMGPAKRDREQPHLNPTSTNEILFYRGLVARAYFEGSKSPEEYAYIPSDLAELIPPLGSAALPPLGRPATPAERKHVLKATDQILDHACTLLAALRIGFSIEECEEIGSDWHIPPNTLTALLISAGILAKNHTPKSNQVRKFLEAPRREALSMLAGAWLSGGFNDLLYIPTIEKEGVWKNNAGQTRSRILSMLAELKTNTWQSLPVWIEDVQQHNPDFQRSGGEYDAWYLRNKTTGDYLRGESAWMDVEGALLDFMITGPLHWLGIIELGAPEKEQPIIAFRFSPWAKALLGGQTPDGLPEENDTLHTNSKLEIDIPPHLPRAARYQIARFTEWAGLRKSNYRYKITPQALERATNQELKIPQLVTLLTKHSSTPLPPNLTKSLKRWEQNGTQARIEPVMVLRVTHPEILEQLKASRAARFLGTPLGPTTITVSPGAWEKVQSALAELGVLAEIKQGNDEK